MEEGEYDLSTPALNQIWKDPKNYIVDHLSYILRLIYEIGLS